MRKLLLSFFLSMVVVACDPPQDEKTAMVEEVAANMGVSLEGLPEINFAASLPPRVMGRVTCQSFTRTVLKIEFDDSFILGRGTIAHELYHVMQCRDGRTATLPVEEIERQAYAYGDSYCYRFKC